MLKCKSKLSNGTTLLELIIVLALLGIIALISWPTYQTTIAISNRKEAIYTLYYLQNLQEKYHNQHLTYASLKDLSVYKSNLKMSKYTLAIAVDSDNDYSAQAIAHSSDNFISDVACNIITIKVHNNLANYLPVSCWPQS